MTATSPQQLQLPKDSPGRGLRQSPETYIAALALLGILTHVAMRYGWHADRTQSDWPLILTLALGGVPLIVSLFKELLKLQLGADILAGLSIAASAALGEYLAGAIVVLMLSGGTALEHYATRRASAVLAALAKRMPRFAHQINGKEFADVSLDAVALGDHLVVFPHEICPVDGVVVEGRGTMDEAYLTGEPYQIGKVPGAAVLSGAVNGESALTVEVTRLPVDSRYSKIMLVMREAEANRPAMRRLADRLGAWYTVLGVAVAILGWILGNDPKRFLAVLVIATPCPLLLAIPVAIIGAISVAATRGIIIKNPGMLEQIGSCRTVIFDKTGTLTYGKPALTEILCAPGVNRLMALNQAASLEQYSKHPLAGSILEASRKENLTLAQVSEIGERPGTGLSGRVGAVNVRVTGRKSAPDPTVLPEQAAGMECILLLDGSYAATFRFHDVPRTESNAFIAHLAPKHEVTKVMLLSGDREAEVRYLAAQVGISEVLFGKSPEEKVQVVRAESKLAPTLFLGDGINDAPAMQAATVGIAFGQNSDITGEAADALVLETSLGKVDELIHIGRRMRSIALQCAIGGMALSMVGMGAAAAGWLPPVTGAILQELIDVAAVLNALRAALPGRILSDAGG